MRLEVFLERLQARVNAEQGSFIYEEVNYMTKFEEIGCAIQRDAETPMVASVKFKQTCSICCARGIHLDCDKCAVSETHSLVMACFRISD